MSNPACFGSPVAVSHLCETCRVCPGRVACAVTATQFLESFPTSPSITRERERMSLVRQALTSSPAQGQGAGTTKRVPLNAKQQGVLDGMAKQTASLVRQLFEKGWFDFARREMAAGRNPGKKDWQKLLCEALMNGGTTRADLVMAYRDKLGMTPGSAKVRASKAVAVFTAGNLLVERDGYLYLSLN